MRLNINSFIDNLIVLPLVKFILAVATQVLPQWSLNINTLKTEFDSFLRLPTLETKTLIWNLGRRAYSWAHTFAAPMTFNNGVFWEMLHSITTKMCGSREDQ